MDDKFVAAIDTPVQWVFNVTGMRGTEGEDGGQHVVISLSGAWKWKDMPKAELRDLFIAEMEGLFPSRRRCQREQIPGSKDARRHVSGRAGSGRYRLPQNTPEPGFFLAGDWTDTGWPSTMEGAVRSGNHGGRPRSRTPEGAGLTAVRALLLAPFSEQAIAELVAAGVEVVHEDWLQTGTLQDPEELGARISRDGIGAVVVEGDFLFAETFDLAQELGFAGICRAAVNQVDVEAATERGVVVVNTPGRNAAAVAELTLGLMLAVARRIPESDRYVRSGSWESPTGPYRELRGRELAGKLAGVVGLGAIGRRVTALCNALGMNVIAYDPYVQPSEAAGLGATWCELDFLIESADVITLHAPPPGDDEPLLTAERIDRMKHGGILINVSAPELVDQHALETALRSQKLGGAGLDIFPTHPVEPSYPLLSLQNVVLTPHIGGATSETIVRHSQAIAEDLLRYRRGVKPINLVNPEVWERRRGT